MSTTTEAVLERQTELFGLISRSLDNLKKLGVANLSKGKIQSRLDNLNSNWKKFQAAHDNLIESRSEFEDHLYFKSKIYEDCEEQFVTAQGEMLDLLDQFSIPTQAANVASLPNASITDSSSSRSHYLPRIELPKFSGNYAQWRTFRDLFSSMVNENSDLSLVEKLHYLKMSVIEEPAQLLKNIVVCSDNFSRAWDILIDRYENKRILVDSHLSALFSARSIKNESSTEVKRLMGEIKENLGALEALGCPINHWDNVLVYMIVRKLDSDSLKDWEKSIGSKKTPPTFEELEFFMVGRIHTLEAIEQMSSVRKTSQHSKHVVNIKTHNASTSIQTCALCKSNHYLSSCKQFLDKSPSQRRDIVMSKNLCFNCLGPHFLKDCRTSKRCRTCHKQHHTTLHNSSLKPHQVAVTTSVSATTPAASSSVESSVHMAQSRLILESPVLLATALINIASHHGQTYSVRALIDQGSEVSFISESLCQLLNLPRRSVNTKISSIGCQVNNSCKGIVVCRIISRENPETEYNVNALVLSKLTSYLPPKVSCSSLMPLLEKFNLADPEFSSSRKIDLILGVDIYSQVIKDGVHRLDGDSILAQNTTLGWILSGPIPAPSATKNVHAFQCNLDVDLRDLMQRFWTQEEATCSTPVLSLEEKECEEFFQKTYTRDPQGRFVVRLPLRNPPSTFGDSHSSALRAFNHMERRFFKDSNFHIQYSKFMEEYLALNHMIEVSDGDQLTYHFFLPHHGVLRDCSSSTKLRVVFNGSQKTSLGMSLNDHLHVGPKLQTDLADILIRWRRHRVVFATDIEKMYRQIRVHQEDWPLQQILWRCNPTNSIKTYQLCTVTYGLACAPYLAIRCLQQLAQEHAQQSPFASNIILHDTYVDDILSGADNVETAKNHIRQLHHVLMAGGFTAKKWLSNFPEALEELPSELLMSSPNLSLEDNLIYRTLGLTWKSSNDTFVFSWKPVKRCPAIITKRNVLSLISQLFDPLGWLAPITIRAKIFMQELWVRNLSWDEQLPLDFIDRWNKFLEEIEIIPNLFVPRWLGISSSSISVEIHGFSDASQEALAAVVYLRVLSSNHEVRVTLISAKTKVAPLKRVTVPRLELCAAVLLTRLVTRVQKTLELFSVPIHLWSDSTVTLHWIDSHPSRWKEFVRNRVTEIQELSCTKWHHVSGKNNPADLASRGTSPSQLPHQSLWWFGPDWLSQPPSFWPSTTPVSTLPEDLEERSTCSAVAVLPKDTYWDLVERYSSLTRLLRITAWCRRFVTLCKKQPNLISVSGVLSPSEINEALLLYVKQTQETYFTEEIAALSSQNCLPRSNPLYRLTPFVDGNGFLRVSGRLRFANLEFNEKHPLILPKSCTLSTLIIDHHHRKTLHGGTQTTLASIRRQFWILGGRIPVRSFIHRCMACVRQKAVVSQQMMGQLPKRRITPGRAFLHSGVDYAGPFSLRTFRGRGAKTYKGYLVVFICLATSAIHLEMATDYSSSGFIAAYRRFTGRRGICATLSSDRGTNLIGADRELKALFTASSKEWKQIANQLANDNTLWKFNPPSAPHFGGKWEAAVKSTKHHLKRVIGETSLTYEEYSTLLVEIECVLNSRPLCPLSNDSNDINVLTPGHFLIGSTLNSIPEPSLMDIETSRLSRWQMIRKMSEQFWNLWSRQYLQHIQNSSKWFQPSHQLQVGSLVLIKDERLPPSKWALARVLELHPGPDGLNRVATIKTSSSTLTRPIVKLCLLPPV